MNAAKAIFEAGRFDENMPESQLEENDITDGKILILDLLCMSELCPSKSEARRLVQQGGIAVDNEKITNIYHAVSKSDLEKGIVVRKGKKIYKKIILLKK